MSYGKTGVRDSFMAGWERTINQLVSWHLDGSAFKKVVDLVSDQNGQEVLHYWFGLYVQVAHHLV